jgi:3-isopropylmalate/(R)-2-methylmalate dehydratase small subunit
MNKAVKGKIFKYGDDVNTDVIFPGKYTYTVTDPAEMAKHAFEDLDPEFVSKVQYGDIVVAGKNFGCGSSREQAAMCLVACGVGAVIAKSFARIYYRNAINCGLAVVVCPEAVDAVEGGESAQIDFDAGIVRTDKCDFAFAPPPSEVQGILAAGGLIQYTKARLARS